MGDTKMLQQSAQVSPVMTDIQSNLSDTSLDHSSSASDDSLSNWLDIWLHDQLVQLQSENRDTARIIQLKESCVEKPPRESIAGENQTCKTLWGLWESLVIQNDLLYYEWYFDDKVRLVLVALGK